MAPKLILASSSSYRRQLLDRLKLNYACASPDIDETPRPQESPLDLSRRLADSKARALASHFPVHWIIGSDQVAACGEKLLAKPGTPERAREQLMTSSGRQVFFYTSVTLLDADTGRAETQTDTTVVTFRALRHEEIERYIALEQPLDCAGSFKVEGLGICLFEKVESVDPTALIGLPLIQLTRMLREWGLDLLSAQR